MLLHWRRALFAIAERIFLVCGLLATRGPPIDQQLTLKQLADGALGGSRPPRRGRWATRFESEVGNKVGYGVYYRVTLLYTRFSRWRGRSADRWMGATQAQTKICQPSTEGSILQDNQSTSLD